MVESRRTRRIRKIIAGMRRDRPQPCMRCGQQIDYDAESGDPNSFNAGHIEAWALRPDLREDPGNYQQEHEGCGKSAGKRHGRDNPSQGMQSEEW